MPFDYFPVVAGGLLNAAINHWALLPPERPALEMHLFYRKWKKNSCYGNCIRKDLDH